MVSIPHGPCPPATTAVHKVYPCTETDNHMYHKKIDSKITKEYKD
jgi:hypothetical protein